MGLKREKLTSAKMLGYFSDAADEFMAQRERRRTDLYRIVARTSLQFFLERVIFATKLSFHQESCFLHCAKYRIERSSFVTCREITIALYARFACTLRLLEQNELLEKSETFPAAVYKSMHTDTSHYNACIGLHFMKCGTINLEAFAVYVYKQPSKQVVFDTVGWPRDVSCLFQRAMIITSSIKAKRR